VLLIVGVTSEKEPFPLDALDRADVILAGVGFRKEIRSIVKLGREFSTTYDGPAIEKSKIEELLSSLADENSLVLSVELEESVRFP